MLHGFHDSVGQLAGQLGLFQSPHGFIDLEQGDYRAINPVIDSAIGANKQGVPAILAILHAALLDSQALDSFVQHLGKIRHLQRVRDFGYGAAEVARGETEQTFGGGRKAAQLEIHSHHRDWNGGRIQDIAEVVAGDVEFPIAVLRLVINGGQLFIGRLQLFLGGTELLIGALQFLVRRTRLFVRGPQLLHGGFMLLDDFAEVVSGLGQLSFGVSNL